MTQPLHVIILAAGAGKRMKSVLPKVLQPIAGQPMPSSDEPLEHPWAGHVDAAVARSLGFRATVPTVYDAQRDGIL